eukprot:scaffold26837_cov186-Cylindrotheca_fusiformis.AAC.1
MADVMSGTNLTNNPDLSAQTASNYLSAARAIGRTSEVVKTYGEERAVHSGYVSLAGVPIGSGSRFA